MVIGTEGCDRLGSPQVTAGIFQGLITSADSIYHLRRLGAGRYTTASGEEVALEDELMLPLVSGKDVSRWSTPHPAWHILFAYAPAAGGDMRLIAAPEMVVSYPLAWAYLSQSLTRNAIKSISVTVVSAGAVMRGRGGGTSA